MIRVFISYSRADAELAARIEKLLIRLEIDRYLDIRDLDLGLPLGGKIDAEIARSTHLLVILSKVSARSSWVAYEVGAANALGVRVIPFLAERDLDVPDFLRPVKNENSPERLEAYFVNLKAEPDRERSRFDLELSAVSVESGFITLEPYRLRVFTPKFDAFGYKELQLSLAIGDRLPRLDSRFVVRPAREGGFSPELFGRWMLAIRVGSPEVFGVVRGKAPLPMGEAQAVLELPLVPEHDWHVGETKQFFATCGPLHRPTRFRSAPLTVKRLK